MLQRHKCKICGLSFWSDEPEEDICDEHNKPKEEPAKPNRNPSNAVR